MGVGFFAGESLEDGVGGEGVGYCDEGFPYVCVAVTDAGEGDGAIGGGLFGDDGLAFDDAAAGVGAAAVAGVEEAADFFVVVGFGSEDGVHLIVEDGRESVLVGDLAE